MFIDPFNIECFLWKSTSTSNCWNIHIKPLRGIRIICGNKYARLLTASYNSSDFNRDDRWKVLLSDPIYFKVISHRHHSLTLIKKSKRTEVTTSRPSRLLAQKRHQDIFALFWVEVDELLGDSSSEASNALSLQLRGTHPLFTSIGNCTLQKV